MVTDSPPTSTVSSFLSHHHLHNRHIPSSSGIPSSSRFFPSSSSPSSSSSSSFLLLSFLFLVFFLFSFSPFLSATTSLPPLLFLFTHHFTIITINFPNLPLCHNSQLIIIHPNSQSPTHHTCKTINREISLKNHIITTEPTLSLLHRHRALVPKSPPAPHQFASLLHYHRALVPRSPPACFLSPRRCSRRLHHLQIHTDPEITTAPSAVSGALRCLAVAHKSASCTSSLQIVKPNPLASSPCRSAHFPLPLLLPCRAGVNLSLMVSSSRL